MMQLYGVGKKILEVDLPDKYREEDFIVQLCNSIGLELEQLSRWIHIEDDTSWELTLANGSLYQHEGILAQWFVETVGQTATTDYIVWWENMLGLVTDPTISVAQRRANILAMMANRVDSPTPDYIRSIVEKYVIEASVTSDPSTYSFTITIINPRAALPVQVQQNITNAVDAVRPAHLAYTIIFTEETWLALGDRTWATIGDVTWANLRF